MTHTEMIHKFLTISLLRENFSVFLRGTHVKSFPTTVVSECLENVSPVLLKTLPGL